MEKNNRVNVAPVQNSNGGEPDWNQWIVTTEDNKTIVGMVVREGAGWHVVPITGTETRCATLEEGVKYVRNTLIPTN